MNIIPLMCVVTMLIGLLMFGCDEREHYISPCQRALSHREIVKDIKPISVSDAFMKERIMEDAAFCDKHPQSNP